MENNIPPQRIYLDYAATTPVRPEVLEAMRPFWGDKFGNASSLHSFGREAQSALEKARSDIGQAIGAEPDEVLFTSGGTEADNLAIQGVGFAHLHKGNHILTSVIEHPAVLNTCRFMEKMGFSVTYLRVDSLGMVDPDEVKKRIISKTILISIMHANNEIGTVQPLQEIAKIAREKEIAFHTDAIQTLGKVPCGPKTLGVDALSLSAHKIYGPKGIGILYLRKGVKIRPIFFGGGHEGGLRSGTENIAGIVGMARAAQLAVEEMAMEMGRQSEMRDRLVRGIRERIEGVHLNGHPLHRLPNNVHLSFSGLDGQKLVFTLDRKGIAVSTGSACSSLHPYPSHVLRAIGLSESFARGSIRISTGLYTTEEEIDSLLHLLPQAVEACRKKGIQGDLEEEALRQKIKERQDRAAGCESVKSVAWAYLFKKAWAKLFKRGRG